MMAFFWRANTLFFTLESSMLELQNRGGNGLPNRPLLSSNQRWFLQQYDHKQAAFAATTHPVLGKLSSTGDSIISVIDEISRASICVLDFCFER